MNVNHSLNARISRAAIEFGAMSVLLTTRPSPGSEHVDAEEELQQTREHEGALLALKNRKLGLVVAYLERCENRVKTAVQTVAEDAISVAEAADDETNTLAIAADPIA